MAMSIDTDILSEDEKVVELCLAKGAYDEDRLFLIGQEIFLLPTVEKIKSGLRVYGTPINCELPLFSVDVYPKNSKVRVNINGEEIPSKYRVEIEKIVAKNFC